jgi:hypothetical protein
MYQAANAFIASLPVGQNGKRKVIYVDDWILAGIGVCDFDVLLDGLCNG